MVGANFYAFCNYDLHQILLKMTLLELRNYGAFVFVFAFKFVSLFVLVFVLVKNWHWWWAELKFPRVSNSASSNPYTFDTLVFLIL